jgi:hypothetical protein
MKRQILIVAAAAMTNGGVVCIHAKMSVENTKDAPATGAGK